MTRATPTSRTSTAHRLAQVRVLRTVGVVGVVLVLVAAAITLATGGAGASHVLFAAALIGVVMLSVQALAPALPHRVGQALTAVGAILVITFLAYTTTITWTSNGTWNSERVAAVAGGVGLTLAVVAASIAKLTKLG